MTSTKMAALAVLMAIFTPSVVTSGPANHTTPPCKAVCFNIPHFKTECESLCDIADFFENEQPQIQDRIATSRCIMEGVIPWFNFSIANPNPYSSPYSRFNSSTAIIAPGSTELVKAWAASGNLVGFAEATVEALGKMSQVRP